MQFLECIFSFPELKSRESVFFINQMLEKVITENMNPSIM